MFDEDDDYYDEDEDFEEGAGVGRIVLVVVLVLGLFVVAVLAAVIVLLSSGPGKEFVKRLVDPAAVTAPAEPAPESAAEVAPEPTPASVDDGFGPMDGSGYDGQKSDLLEQQEQQEQAVAQQSAGGRDGEVASDEERQREAGRESSRPPQGRSDRSGSSDYRRSQNAGRDSARSPRSSSRSGSSDGWSDSDEGLVIRSDATDTSSSRSRSSSGRSNSAPSKASSSSSRRSSEPQRSARSTSATESRSSASDQPRVLDASESASYSGSEERAAETGPVAELDKGAIASMSGRASSGRLTREELRALRSLPNSHPQFTLAWATAMKHSEVKKDYKGHCEASRKIVELPRNKYHPEWNLEHAKCQLRNGQLDAAIRSIDRTLADSMSMTSSTKMQRLLLAYEIKARSRTKLYDDHAKANSGLGDEIKLNAALDAWTGYRNYAAGIGDQQALRKADREIGDLSARK